MINEKRSVRECDERLLKEKIDIAGQPTEWFEMTQDRVNNFADATLDQQWIHVDPDRAAGGPLRRSNCAWPINNVYYEFSAWRRGRRFAGNRRNEDGHKFRLE